MQAKDWAELFRNIPHEDQNALLLGLSNGVEVAIQDFLRVDDNYLLVRGRVGGTNDDGRVFCFPYAQLTFFCFARPIAERTLRSVFGDLLHSLAESGPLAVDQTANGANLDESENPDQATPMPIEAAKPDQPSTQSLRDRLRARLASSSADYRR